MWFSKEKDNTNKIEGQPCVVVVGNRSDTKRTLVRTIARLERLEKLMDKVKAGTRSGSLNDKRRLRESIVRYQKQKEILEAILSIEGEV